MEVLNWLCGRKGKDVESSIKAFNMPFEAWYKDTVLGEPHIYVGMYYESRGRCRSWKNITEEWENVKQKC